MSIPGVFNKRKHHLGLKMIHLAVIFVITIFLYLFYIHLSQIWNPLYRRVEKMFPGPKILPLVGNGHLFSTPEASFFKFLSLSHQYERFFRVYVGSMVFIVLYDYRDVETVLSSNIKLDKGSVYQFLYPWIGKGLLTSAGEKWKSRRRMITPAFHFKILESYIDLFNSNGIVLCQKISQYCGKGPFNVQKWIKLYALDNICEAAMKYEANALINSESAYVKAIKTLASTVVKRAFTFYLHNDFVFGMSSYGKAQREALRVVSDITNKIIRERREKFAKEKDNQPELTKHEHDSEMYSKKRLVFLDILLSSEEEYKLTDEDICEEVNTFMFEGHDTVSSGISFALHALAANPEVQETAYQEQIRIFGDSKRLPNLSDLNEMIYLEMVLKEAQRLYPSVPMIGRRIHEDIKLKDGYVLPEGCQLTLFISRLHRDPKVWPNPDKFNPLNFSPEEVAKRNPYAYVPFSAGSRNCIGQRFAMWEMKACLSKILRDFKLLPSPNADHELQVYGELVLVNKNGVNIRVEER